MEARAKGTFLFGPRRRTAARPRPRPPPVVFRQPSPPPTRRRNTHTCDLGTSCTCGTPLWPRTLSALPRWQRSWANHMVVTLIQGYYLPSPELKQWNHWILDKKNSLGAVKQLKLATEFVYVCNKELKPICPGILCVISSVARYGDDSLLLFLLQRSRFYIVFISVK